MRVLLVLLVAGFAVLAPALSVAPNASAGECVFIDPWSGQVVIDTGCQPIPATGSPPDR